MCENILFPICVSLCSCGRVPALFKSMHVESIMLVGVANKLFVFFLGLFAIGSIDVSSLVGRGAVMGCDHEGEDELSWVSRDKTVSCHQSKEIISCYCCNQVVSIALVRT